MNALRTSAVPKLFSFALVACLALASFAPASFGAGEPAPAEARAIAAQAYLYGYPLVMNYKAMYLSAVAKESPEFKAPFNEIKNVARVSTPDDKAIVCPQRRHAILLGVPGPAGGAGGAHDPGDRSGSRYYLGPAH